MGEAAIWAAERKREQAERKRGRSTIPFAYIPLSRCEPIPQALARHLKTEATPEELARWLNTDDASGFRSQVASAVIYGLVTTAPHLIKLEPLGDAIAHEAQREAARVAAFENVPLFLKLYEMLEGEVLPEKEALESMIRDLGVPEGQLERARQVFTKTALEVGFLTSSKARLMRPRVEHPTPPTRLRPVSGDQGVNLPGLPALVEALVEKLPRGPRWSRAKQKAWLEAARVVLPMAYEDGDG